MSVLVKKDVVYSELSYSIIGCAYEVCNKLGSGHLEKVYQKALKDAGIKKQMVQTSGGDIGLIKNLGTVLFKEYVVPFEISSVLFLSAMVGAVVIGKKE